MDLRVLGLGNIGPHAGLPVMEGKALLFKYLGGVDAVALCLATQDAREFVRTVQLLEPAFGAINLEDIAQPRCFRVLEELRKTMAIPVWHDDQQGTATALLAGLIGALKVVGKQIDSIRIAMIGMGAANVASYRLLKAYGVDPAQIVACDSRGTLHRGRRDIEDQQIGVCRRSGRCAGKATPTGLTGGIEQALQAPTCVLPSLVRSGSDPARLGSRDGQGCDRVRMCQPDARDLAVGCEGRWSSDRGDGTQRFPQPTE